MKQWIFFAAIFLLIAGIVAYQYNYPNSFGGSDGENAPYDKAPLSVGYKYVDTNYTLRSASTADQCKSICYSNKDCTHYTFDSTASGEGVFSGNIPCLMFTGTPGDMEVCFDCVSGSKK